MGEQAAGRSRYDQIFLGGGRCSALYASTVAHKDSNTLLLEIIFYTIIDWSDV